MNALEGWRDLKSRDRCFTKRWRRKKHERVLVLVGSLHSADTHTGAGRPFPSSTVPVSSYWYTRGRGCALEQEGFGLGSLFPALPLISQVASDKLL